MTNDLLKAHPQEASTALLCNTSAGQATNLSALAHEQLAANCQGKVGQNKCPDLVRMN